VTLPFALLEWPTARYAFFALSWAVVAWTFLRSAFPPCVQLAMLAPMIMGLHFGALEPLLFGLLVVAVRRQNESEPIFALALGSALALKIYPVVLLYLLWRNGRRRAVLRTIAVAGGIGLITTGAFGLEVWLDWLRFSGVNARHFIPLSINLSLAGVLHMLTGVSPTLISIGLLIGLSLPLGFVAKGIEPMLPVMLLASPFTWPHYMPIGLLGALPRALLAAGGLALATNIASLYGFLPVTVQPAISLAATICLALVWLHSVWAGYRAGSRGGGRYALILSAVRRAPGRWMRHLGAASGRQPGLPQ
jgi:hypothetical protein